MPVPDKIPATDILAQFVADLSCDRLPPELLNQMGVLLVDLFRVAAIGTHEPWVAKVRAALEPLGGNPLSSILFSNTRIDPVRATYINSVISGSLEWDDTHVGAMLHPGVVVWPAVFAIAEMQGSSGAEMVAAAVAGYETMIRIGLSVQPSHFRRGFQSTATCGAFGSAAAAAKLLKLDKNGIRDALGLAASYAGGISQFFLSGSEVKRLHAGKASAAGVEAALLAHARLTGPHDAIEGDQGFARAFADAFDPSAITEGLGSRYNIADLTLKPHAGSARLQAAIEAASELAGQIGSLKIEAVEIGIPAVIEGRLTNNAPKDLQQAQMSVPFAVAMSLILTPQRPQPLLLTLEDFADSVRDEQIRALSLRTNCVLDADIERATTKEYVPARVKVSCVGGQTFEHMVPLPLGSPKRPITSAEIGARFRAVAAAALSGDAESWLARASTPHKLNGVNELMGLRLKS